MTSDEQVTVTGVHQALEGLMLLINEHTDLSVLKPDHLYFLIEPQVSTLRNLLDRDGAANTP